MIGDNMDFSDDSFEEQASARYGFSYTSFFDKKATVSEKIYTLGEDAWPNQLEEFVNFLEGIYGYSIRSKIALRDKGPLYNWTGPVFDPDTLEVNTFE